MQEAYEAGIPAIGCIRFPNVGVMGVATGDISSLMALNTILLLKIEKQTGMDAYELAVTLRKMVRDEKKRASEKSWSDYNPKWEKAEGLQGKD